MTAAQGAITIILRIATELGAIVHRAFIA